MPLLINLPEVLKAVVAGVQVEGQGEAGAKAGGVGPRAHNQLDEVLDGAGPLGLY